MSSWYDNILIRTTQRETYGSREDHCFLFIDHHIISSHSSLTTYEISVYWLESNAQRHGVIYSMYHRM